MRERVWRMTAHDTAYSYFRTNCKCEIVIVLNVLKELLAEEATNNSEAGLCGIVSNVVNQSVSVNTYVLTCHHFLQQYILPF